MSPGGLTRGCRWTTGSRGKQQTHTWVQLDHPARNYQRPSESSSAWAQQCRQLHRWWRQPHWRRETPQAPRMYHPGDESEKKKCQVQRDVYVTGSENKWSKTSPRFSVKGSEKKLGEGDICHLLCQSHRSFVRVKQLLNQVFTVLIQTINCLSCTHCQPTIWSLSSSSIAKLFEVGVGEPHRVKHSAKMKV